MDTSKNSNPFYGLTIGATLNATNGRYGPSVVRGNITRLISQSQVWKSMRGQSDFVYTKTMNQGSAGVSGSYGISGVSKVTAAVSAYYGSSSADSGKSMEVNYEAMVCGGVEYINFDDLRAADLMNALAESPKALLSSALNNFNLLNSSLETLKVDLAQVISNPSKPEYAEALDIYRRWSSNCTRFRTAHGDGLIVAVAWGAVGTVSMKMTSNSNDSSKKYGGSAEFSYASVGFSATVGATYDGSQSKGSASVAVECSSYSSGACIATQIDEWMKQVTGKNFDQLANVNVMAQAPEISVKQNPPKVPEFHKPEKDQKVTDMLDKVKNLEGLHLYAKAAAYDEAKKKNPELKLEDFLQQSTQNANVQALTTLANNVAQNNISTQPATTRAMPLSAAAEPEQEEPMTRAAGVAAGSGNADYVPIAVWISNWSDLFPWLASGVQNSIDSSAQIDPAIRFRVLQQDLMALAKLYAIADGCKMSNSVFDNINFSQIADTYANLSALMSGRTDYEQAVREAHAGLVGNAGQIYAKWNEIGFLRNCELGLGVMREMRLHPENHATIAYGAANADADKAGFYPFGELKCDFHYDSASGKGNYAVFAQAMKPLPLILPNGKIYAFGPGNGVLCKVSGNFSVAFVITFTAMPNFFFANKNNSAFGLEAMELQVDAQNKTLSNAEQKLVMYPIPFDAAKGIAWKGQSFSTNVASMPDLNAQLSKINKELSTLKAWSFSSENWATDWSGDSFYGFSSVRKQFLGLVDESMFPLN